MKSKTLIIEIKTLYTIFITAKTIAMKIIDNTG